MASTSGAFGSRETNPSTANATRMSESYKSSVSDDYALFILNTKATSPPLSIRKLAPQDLLLRVFARAVEIFKKDGEERFKVVFAR